jgi:outer membrane putative beta-barrel porin/alpha-amylase
MLMIRLTATVIFCIVAAAQLASAGPPFNTDDPEPVEYQHWEVYLASRSLHDKGGWSGTLPELEVNYGVIPNLQLHLIAPVSYVAPAHDGTRFGYGDTELGAKYRFFEETEFLPQVGAFPLVELPSGDRKRGLGTGHVEAFFPIWLQKSFEPWTTYGGGGYWVNPGKGNRNWWFIGWELQREVFPGLILGAEVFHETPSEKDGESDTRLNFGAIYDFSDSYHLLLSAGHTVQGPSGFQSYIAFQITFGPEKPADGSKNSKETVPETTRYK